MLNTWRALWAVTLLALANTGATAGELDATQACSRLVATAEHRHLAAFEKPAGHYHCVSQAETGRPHVLRLHYAGGESADWVGSTMVGYFAVRKKDGAVLEWDFAADRPGKLIRR